MRNFLSCLFVSTTALVGSAILACMVVYGFSPTPVVHAEDMYKKRLNELAMQYCNIPSHFDERRAMLYVARDINSEVLGILRRVDGKVSKEKFNDYVMGYASVTNSEKTCPMHRVYLQMKKEAGMP